MTELTTPDRVRDLVEPLVAGLGVDLYDLELNSGSLRVTVDQPGGIGMDVIAEVTRTLSRAIDEHDPINGHFTLEVSSPGLERVLRTPAHYVGAVGTPVTVKTVAGYDGPRRLTGVIRQADEQGFELGPPEGAADPAEPTRLDYDVVERTRTIFEWGPTPKPGKSPQNSSKKKQKNPNASTKQKSASKPSASPNEKVPTS